MGKVYIYSADDHISYLANTIDADCHKHLDIQISISMAETFKLSIAEKEVFCNGVIINSNVSHGFNGRKGLNLLVLIDNASILAQQIRSKYLGQSESVILSETIVTNIRKLVNDKFYYIANAKEYEIFMDDLYKILDLRQNYIPRVVDSRIQGILLYLSNCKESDISLDIIAKKVCLSKSRVSHLFKENVGISLSSYIINHKLKEAFYLVFQGMNITEASLMAGFDSPSHFANTSRQKFGMTPREINKDSRFLKVSKY